MSAKCTFTVVAKVVTEKPLTRDQKRAAIKRYKEEFIEYFEDDMLDAFGDMVVPSVTSVTIV